MLNLLPKDSRKEIKGEYRLRVTAVTGIFLLIIAFFVGLFLLPSFILSVSRENVALNRQKELQNIEAVENTSGSKVALVKAANELSLIETNNGTSTMYALINQVLGHRTEGIHISSISISDKTMVTLAGTADDRPSLVAFTNSLDAEASFANVNVPISDFSKDSNIPFSLSFTLK